MAQAAVDSPAPHPAHRGGVAGVPPVKDLRAQPGDAGGSTGCPEQLVFLDPRHYKNAVTYLGNPAVLQNRCFLSQPGSRPLPWPAICACQGHAKYHWHRSSVPFLHRKPWATQRVSLGVGFAGAWGTPRESCSGQPNLFLAKPDRIMWTGTAGQLAGKHRVFSSGDVAEEWPQWVAAGPCGTGDPVLSHSSPVPTGISPSPPAQCDKEARAATGCN